MLKCTHSKHKIAHAFSRAASTASVEHRRHPEHGHKYPFPRTPHPSAHQIFHLRSGATQAEIKARYYDLVRIHHPDSLSTHHLDVAERQRRFQAIQTAYDILRGKISSNALHGHHEEHGASAAWQYAAEVARRKRRAEAAYNRTSARDAWGFTSQREWTASADDRWKDRMIVWFAVACVVAGFAPAWFYGPSYYAHQKSAKASQALGLARQEAGEVHEERRERIKQRVDEYYRSRLRERQEPVPPLTKDDAPPERLV